jgi:transposase
MGSLEVAVATSAKVRAASCLADARIFNAIFYVLRGGVPWRMLPPCFPPYQTVYGWFAMLRDSGTWQSLNHRLVMLDRV